MAAFMAAFMPSKMKLKLLVDTSARKVLYAEVDKDFVDFLASLMLMQVGLVARVLSHDRLAGSLGELYGSLEGLGLENWLPNIDRVQILRPTPPTSALKKTLVTLRYDGLPAGAVGSGTGSVKGSGTLYMVTDELVVTPLATDRIIKTLKEVEDNVFLQEREVEFGSEEAINLLKSSLSSRSVLTKVFLGRTGS